MTGDATALKRQAGEQAAALVESGMLIGLGTGSTAIFATRRIAARLRAGELRDIVAIATSRATDAAARELGIPMLTDDLPRAIDLTIDGADEVDPALDLIKGGGGALLREKIVAQASRRIVIVVDESKLSRSARDALAAAGGGDGIRLALAGALPREPRRAWSRRGRAMAACIVPIRGT